MILILLVAAVVSGLLGEVLDAAAIVAIVVLNAIVGFVQEYRAEKAMDALQAMAAPVARVRRGGRALTVDAARWCPATWCSSRPGPSSPRTCGSPRWRACAPRRRR